MKYTKDGPDDGRPEYTGVTTREAIDKEWMDKLEHCLQSLEDALVDTDTNFGMNEAYRMALGDVSHKMVVLYPFTPTPPITH